MSFTVVKKKFGSKGQVYSYAYVVHSERRGDKVVQVVEKYLGKVKGAFTKGALKAAGAVGKIERNSTGRIVSGSAKEGWGKSGYKTKIVKLKRQGGTGRIVSMSFIKGFAYNPKTKVMDVTIGGTTYKYSGVPKNVAKKFSESKSFGSAFGMIKNGGYSFKKYDAETGKPIPKKK